MHAIRLSALGLALFLAAACGGGQKVTPPPDPFRPEPIEEVKPSGPTRTDCDPPDPSNAKDAMTYAERAPSIGEAQQLADEGFAELTAAEGDALDPQTREDKITRAVEDFLSALGADPYNVHATYNLAAAYARIGRNQCALNLLVRLIAMKDHQSRKVEVGKKFDRLLGRNGQTIDPDFRKMRDDAGFRCVIANIAAATPTLCFGPGASGG